MALLLHQMAVYYRYYCHGRPCSIAVNEETEVWNSGREVSHIIARAAVKSVGRNKRAEGWTERLVAPGYESLRVVSLFLFPERFRHQHAIR